MSEADYYKRIDKYLRGNLSHLGKVITEGILEIGLRNAETGDLDEAERRMMASINGQLYPNEKPRGKKAWWRLVAVFVFACLASISLWWYYRTVPVNKLILDDGTIIWLRESARLSTKEFSQENRMISLSGEALFEVEKDSLHPFRIRCGHQVVTVVGTSFNLKSDSTSLELIVLSGKVIITSSALPAEVEVAAKEKISVIDGQAVVHKTGSRPDEQKRVTDHTEYDMKFQDAKVTRIISRIEDKFNVNIELEDSKLGQCLLSADFTDQSLAATMSMLSEAIHATYQIKRKRIVISGSGCTE